MTRTKTREGSRSCVGLFRPVRYAGLSWQSDDVTQNSTPFSLNSASGRRSQPSAGALTPRDGVASIGYRHGFCRSCMGRKRFDALRYSG